MPEKSQVRFQWVVDDTNLDEYRAELLSLGAELKEAQPYNYSSDEIEEYKALAIIGPMFLYLREYYPLVF